MKRRPGRKRARGSCTPIPKALLPKARWSLDFLAVSFGRRCCINRLKVRFALFPSDDLGWGKGTPAHQTLRATAPRLGVAIHPQLYPGDTNRTFARERYAAARGDAFAIHKRPMLRSGPAAEVGDQPPSAPEIYLGMLG